MGEGENDENLTEVYNSISNVDVLGTNNRKVFSSYFVEGEIFECIGFSTEFLLAQEKCKKKTDNGSHYVRLFTYSLYFCLHKGLCKPTSEYYNM